MYLVVVLLFLWVSSLSGLKVMLIHKILPNYSSKSCSNSHVLQQFPHSCQYWLLWVHFPIWWLLRSLMSLSIFLLCCLSFNQFIVSLMLNTGILTLSGKCFLYFSSVFLYLWYPFLNDFWLYYLLKKSVWKFFFFRWWINEYIVWSDKNNKTVCTTRLT